MFSSKHQACQQQKKSIYTKDTEKGSFLKENILLTNDTSD